MRLLLLAALLLVPAAAAQDAFYLADGDGMTARIEPTSEGAAIDFVLQLRSASPGQAYAKVLPVEGNPVFMNGTSDAGGWWTEFIVDGVRVGVTEGREPVTLGAVGPGAPLAATARVHAPAGALVAEGAHRLRYILAVHVDAGEGSSSGGSLDPSLALGLELQVGEIVPVAGEDPAGAAGEVGWLRQAWSTAGQWAAIVLLLGAAGFVGWRRMRR